MKIVLNCSIQWNRYIFLIRKILWLYITIYEVYGTQLSALLRLQQWTRCLSAALWVLGLVKVFFAFCVRKITLPPSLAPAKLKTGNLPIAYFRYKRKGCQIVSWVVFKFTSFTYFACISLVTSAYAKINSNKI